MKIQRIFLWKNDNHCKKSGFATGELNISKRKISYELNQSLLCDEFVCLLVELYTPIE